MLFYHDIGYSQDITSKNKHALGVNMGFTTGYGITYRYYIEDFVLQTSFSPEIERKNEYLVNAALGVLYRIRSGDKINLYAYTSAYYYRSKNHRRNYRGIDIYDILHPDASKNNNSYNLGTGLSFEFIILERLSLNLMFGYAAYNNFDHLNMTAELGTFFVF